MRLGFFAPALAQAPLVSRVVAAIFGGYALAALASVAALVLPLREGLPVAHDRLLRRPGRQLVNRHTAGVGGRRGDLIKLLWFDGQGMLLLAKRLERGRFIWPRASDGRVVLTPAQLSMLLEGIDWRMPARTQVPELAA